MNRFYRLLLFVFISASALLSCNKDKALAECNLEHCTPGAVTYENDIKPLIQQSCATNMGPGTGCHDAWIFNYDNVKTSIDNGVFGSVIADESMPKVPNSFGILALTQAEKELFECWICDGALEN